jgi:cation:H+ antiporter
MIFLWILTFVASLVLLIKGSDWILESTEKIGALLGFSPFVIGVVLVGAGTSFPELVSSFAALVAGAPEIIVANAVGSNIANILLVIGIAAVLGRKLTVTKSLIDLDLPLFALATTLLLAVVWDGSVHFFEALILTAGYGVYLSYVVSEHNTEKSSSVEIIDVIPSRLDRALEKVSLSIRGLKQPKKLLHTFSWFGLGLLSVIVGAKFLVDSVVAFSELFNIGVGAVSLVAISLGTSLPEIFVSAQAALQKKSEVALGNVFGSNVFNMLAVVGIPGLFSTLPVDSTTLIIGVPALIVSSLLFVITGISRRIHIWEGVLFILLYILFVSRLFAFF